MIWNEFKDRLDDRRKCLDVNVLDRGRTAMFNRQVTPDIVGVERTPGRRKEASKDARSFKYIVLYRFFCFCIFAIYGRSTLYWRRNN